MVWKKATPDDIARISYTQREIMAQNKKRNIGEKTPLDKVDIEKNEFQSISFTLKDKRQDQYIPEMLGEFASGSWLKLGGGDDLYQYKGILASDPSKVVIGSNASDFDIISKNIALKYLRDSKVW